MKKPFLLDKKAIKHRFNQASKTYHEHALVYREVEERLLSKLEFIKIDPKIALDLGCGLGGMMAVLKQRFSSAQVVGVDFAHGMLKVGCDQNQWLVAADTLQLPFESASIDLVVSNLLLPWVDDLNAFFQEVARVLQPGGLLLFSTLGPDTFQELRRAWGQIDAQSHVHVFFDMHDIGDALLQSGLADPVMDVEHLTMQYPLLEQFFLDLKFTASTNTLQTRPVGLLTSNKLARLKQSYPRVDEKYFVTYEIAYGHAWKNAVQKTEQNEFYFSIEQLRKRVL